MSSVVFDNRHFLIVSENTVRSITKLDQVEHFGLSKKAAVISNFCLIGKIHHNFLVLRMIELACKTFMHIQTLNVHRVHCKEDFLSKSMKPGIEKLVLLLIPAAEPLIKFFFFCWLHLVFNNWRLRTSKANSCRYFRFRVGSCLDRLESRCFLSHS